MISVDYRKNLNTVINYMKLNSNCINFMFLLKQNNLGKSIEDIFSLILDLYKVSGNMAYQHI